MLLPKRVQHRKQHRGRMKGRAMRGNRVAHGEYGLVALEPSWITNRQIEAARIAMTRYIKSWRSSLDPDFPGQTCTAKAAGSVWVVVKVPLNTGVAVVKPGRVMFEMAGVTEEVAREAMRLAGNKLPIKTRFVSKEQLDAEVTARENGVGGEA